MPGSALRGNPGAKAKAMSRQANKDPTPRSRASAGRVQSGITGLQRKYPRAVHANPDAHTAGGYTLYDDEAGVHPIKSHKAVYATPSSASKHFQMKQAMKHSGIFDAPADHPEHVTNWTVDGQETAAVEQLVEAQQLREWDDFLRRFVDIRKPGMLAWMRSIDPEYVDRIMDAINRDIHLWKRLKIIDVTGVQNRGDVELLFTLCKGELIDTREDAGGYVPGFFAPQKTPANQSAGWYNLLEPGTAVAGRGNDTYANILGAAAGAKFGSGKQIARGNDRRGYTGLRGAPINLPFVL